MRTHPLGFLALALWGVGCTADYHEARGRLALDRDDAQTAELHYGIASDKDPGRASAWAGLGWALQAQQLFGEAEGAFNQCITHDAKAHDCMRGLAVVRMGQGRADEAGAFLTTAISLAPSDPDIRSTEGLLAIAEGQHEKAVTLFEKLVHDHPDNVGYVVGLCQALLRRVRPEEVLALTEGALESVGSKKRFRALLHVSRMQAFLMTEPDPPRDESCGDRTTAIYGALRAAEAEWRSALATGIDIVDRARLEAMLEARRARVEKRCGQER